MDQSTDAKSLPTKTPSAIAVSKYKSEILTEWEAQVRSQIDAAAQLPRPILIDTIPTYLDNLAEALAEEHSRNFATESTSIPQEHGGERARLSRYSPDQIILEFQILRNVVAKKINDKAGLTERDRTVIQKSIDQAVCESMVAYFLVHNRIREQFMASLTHDLRNPLSAAKMSAELLLVSLTETGESTNPEYAKGLVQRVINNTKRVDRMIQDLLDTTVINMGERIPLRIAECEILAIIKEVIMDLGRKDAHRIHLQGVPCWGQWDADAIRRAIENLVTNAIKYGKTDTPVTIRITTVEERMMVSVHNEGDEIPLQERELLFQPFRRTQAAKAGGKKGWGIGLALVRGVAEGHGGSIGLDSSPLTGTTFMIDIPVDARPFQEAPLTEG